MYSALFALGVLVLTTATPVAVSDIGELSRLRFGKPLWYVAQDQSWRSPPLPYEAHLGWAAESATHIDVARAFGDFVFWYFLVEVASAVARFFFRQK
ncbi:MAG TPA: hypothetical protein VGJ81_05350 [Thermoanaerobaculia bacterium]|jgi:hypothetical protein